MTSSAPTVKVWSSSWLNDRSSDSCVVLETSCGGAPSVAFHVTPSNVSRLA